MNKDHKGSSLNGYKVAAFYTFTSLDDETISQLIEKLTLETKSNNVRGSILIASEGVNGTICGLPDEVSLLLSNIQDYLGKKFLEIKFSWTNRQAFRRFKARKKKEIVTMGVPQVDPSNIVGNYVEPKEWNKYLTDSHTLVVDTRNEYEVAIGSFKGSLNPHTDTFREFPRWVDNTLIPLLEESSAKRIALFCTGGIRCEKATSYLKSKGLEDVHHLHGGILRYLEQVSESESLWEGECFVFDQRVSLNHELLPGSYRLCHACGMPVSPQETENEFYIHGIQCHHCIDLFDDNDRARFAERQRQIDDFSRRLPDNSIWPNSMK